jgi:hypothetical protein
MVSSDLLQGFSNKSDTVMIQQECYKVDDTRLQQYCYIMTVSHLLEQPCKKSDSINLLQVVNSLFQTCWQIGTSSAKTTCWQTCYKMWDFCVRSGIQTITCKNAQVVTNLQQTCSNAVPTTCQQVVFALLVPSLLTTCYKVVELNRLVASYSNNLLSSCNSTICQQIASDNLVATW